MEGRNYFMVRAKDSSGEYFNILEKNRIVGVGWSKVRFRDYKYEDIAEAVKNAYSDYTNGTTAPQVVGKKLNEVRRFKSIKDGDIVIVPHSSEVWIAKATGEERYDENSIKLDIANQKEVNYFRNEKDEIIAIPRTELSEGLSRRLRVRGSSVSDLSEFKEEIEKICSGIKEKGAYTYTNDYALKRNEAVDKFKNTLLDKIQNGKTHLETGGIGLEKLVEELLKCEGFAATILPKNKFPGEGDVDIEAKITHSIFSYENEVVYFVQVKHHSGISGSKGVTQLIKARDEILQNEYSNAIYVFLTSATIDEETKNLAEENDIICMDGHDLVGWIFDNYNKLGDDTLQKLDICKIPRFI